jgi:hypothetical protein
MHNKGKHLPSGGYLTLCRKASRLGTGIMYNWYSHTCSECNYAVRFKREWARYWSIGYEQAFVGDWMNVWHWAMNVTDHNSTHAYRRENRLREPRKRAAESLLCWIAHFTFLESSIRCFSHCLKCHLLIENDKMVMINFTVFCIEWLQWRYVICFICILVKDSDNVLWREILLK